MKTLDLKQLFTNNVCSFEMAKKMKEAGMTCANTFFVYDSQGEVADAGWMEELGFNDFYPCINLAFAISMIEDTAVPVDKIELWEMDNDKYPTGKQYFFKCEGDETLSSENLIDLILMVYLKYKK
jgi:hypothetical protein